MIEQFTIQEFENSLPDDAMPQGLQSGEFGFEIPLPHARIVIRSSIGPDGLSAGTGQDSIRLWVEVKMSDGKYKPLKKLDAYTTRVKGWQKRMNDKIEQLRQKGNLFTFDSPVCPECGNGWPNISQSAKNPNRAFVSCRNHNYFQWVDEVNANRGVEKESAPTSPISIVSELDSLFEELPEPEPQKEITPSDQQLAIINHDISTPIRVLATAGSGKTWTTEQYIKRLVDEGAKPGSILYVTYNKTMAESGRERIENTLISNEIPVNDASEFGKWFCTIHAACYRMLKADGMKRTPAKNWEIKKLLQEIISELWSEHDAPTPRSLLIAIENAKHNNLTPLHDLSLGNDLEFFDELFGEFHGGKASRARRIFDQKMKSENKLTFSDMLFLVEQKLNNSFDFRQKWQSQFQHVIVDEGQDTNQQAMRILTALSSPQDQFVIVGDSDQMMYRFAGSSPEYNLLDGFSDRFPDGKLYMMDTNYRSYPSIVNYADKLIRHNYANMGGRIAEAFRKIINPFSKQDGNHVHFEMYEDIHEEAYEVAKSIKRKLEDGETVPGEIFVGGRTRSQLGNLETVFTKMKIPFVNITGNSFWNFRHMKIAVAYLRLIHDPTDKIAFKTIYNVASSNMTVPWRGNADYGRKCATRFLGKAFLAEFPTWLKLSGELHRVPSKWQAGAGDIYDFLDALEYEIQEEGLSSGINYIIDECLRDWLNSEDDLSSDGDDSKKLDDLYTLLDLESKHKTLESLLSHIDAAIEAANSARTGELNKYVVLSTYHRLKGLERDYVYGLGWCEGAKVKTDEPVGLLPHTYALRPPPRNDPLDLSEQSSVDDERCIGFVLLTRARMKVYLSGIKSYRNARMWPSRFVKEMGLI